MVLGHKHVVQDLLVVLLLVPLPMLGGAFVTFRQCGKAAPSVAPVAFSRETLGSGLPKNWRST